MSFDTARRLYLVRRTVLEMLQDRGYFIDKPELDLSREDFDDRYTSKDALAINWDEMTILVQHKEDPVDQIFVFFPADPKVGVKQVKAFAERMRSDKAAKAILVTEAKLTVFARQCLSEMAPKYHVELFLQSELLVNITRHSAVPQHELLSREERAELLRRYKIKETQLPRIQHNDPIARYYGLSRGSIVRILRDSETAGRYVTYRMCV